MFLQPISRLLKGRLASSYIINGKVPLKVGDEMAFNEIESKRKTLIDLAQKYGLNSDVTLKCSQELDHLLLQEIKQRHSNLQHGGHRKSQAR
ncbi:MULTISPECIES: aspartyl-phosphate phosphatase Spo0E family protein [Bacillaceae]|uniref:Aspartyl-phosphate phosphatase Spo0E family protein n=1 Tax=Metabacillus sediminis TaxID=3117746 RepID=A0ABZ2NJV2_9BACI|nr:hypothetical protein AS29_010370 [Bacillus sp. SJS]